MKYLLGHSPPFTDSRVGVSYKPKYVHEILVNHLVFKLAHLFWVCTVILGLSGRQLVFEIL